PASAEERPIAPVVAGLVNTVMVPAYERFAKEAGAQAARVGALCEAPSPQTLAEAREGFAPLLSAFAGIEPYRFGPAREENRYERLFFWPDRRGRGLRQVQGVLASEDATAIDPATLTGKSVAVQGLPALEFVLFGTGSDDLAAAASYRCAYANAMAQAIATVAEEMVAGWTGGFAQTMTATGEANPAYRSDAEALQDILQAAATQLELAGTQKLAAVIGAEPSAARPKRAPFWRSDLSLAMVSANVAAVRALLEGGVADLLEDDTLVRSALFELSQVDRAIGSLVADERSFEALTSDPDAHRRLAFAVIPMAAAERIIVERIQGALGLAAGFNALDGD
ncbi:MAG: imelysin family protein, partial [Pseudomonadota bacterium]